MITKGTLHLENGHSVFVCVWVKGQMLQKKREDRLMAYVWSVRRRRR